MLNVARCNSTVAKLKVASRVGAILIDGLDLGSSPGRADSHSYTIYISPGAKKFILLDPSSVFISTMWPFVDWPMSSVFRLLRRGAGQHS